MPASALPSRIQDLPPNWARFCLGIERFLLHDLSLPIRDSRFLLSCSAGSDSTALLMVLHCLAPRLGITIIVAHLDHGLRPESAAEARQLADLCARLGRSILTGHGNVAKYAQRRGIGLEEAGRDLRYRFLFAMHRRVDADYLVTAHHADDLAEDLLMRLIRGVGWPALSGMPCWDPGRRLLRPLLHTPKQTLRDFLRDIGLTWAEDPSNVRLEHTRNRVRLELLPLLVRENPRFLSSVIRLHQQGSQDADFFDSQIASLLERTAGQSRVLDSSLLASLHPSLRLRLYKAVIEELGPGQVLHDSVLRLDRAWQHGTRRATLQFPGGKTALVTPEGVRFLPSQTEPNLESPNQCD